MSQAVQIVAKPVGQPSRAGRRFGECEQPSHQGVNLVAGERHVAHQQAHQCGESETHRWGRGRKLLRTPIEEVSKAQQASKENLSGPAASAMELSL